MELLCLGAVCAAFFTPLSMRLAKAVGAIDIPDGERKRHARPTARLGGIAVFFAVLLGALWLLPPSPLRAAWLAGGALLCVLGVSDDIFSLSPALKLAAELAIATLPVAFGVTPIGFSLFSHAFTPPVYLMNILCVLWVMALSNAFNLIDGLDTLAVSQAMLSLSLFTGRGEGLLFFGALYGFLPYNKPSLTLPLKRTGTRSFLGDTGALFLGYSLALFSLSEGARVPLLLPLAFLFPLFECASSFFRRLLRGKNPLSADRGHLHHILLEKTGSAEKTVLALSIFSLAGLAVLVLLR